MRSTSGINTMMHRVNKTSSLESQGWCNEDELLSCLIDESKNKKRGTEQHTGNLHFSKASTFFILLSKLDYLHALILFYIMSEYKINNHYYFIFYMLQRCIKQQLFSSSNVISQKLKVKLSLILWPVTSAFKPIWLVSGKIGETNY